MYTHKLFVRSLSSFAVAVQELEDRGNPTIGSQREAEGEDPPQKRARVESAPA